MRRLSTYSLNLDCERLIAQYDIPSYFPLTSFTPFVLDYSKKFERSSFNKYVIQPRSLMPPLRSKQDVATWYTETRISWAQNYTIILLDGAELLFSSVSTGALQSRITDILGYPIDGTPQGLLPPRLNYMMFYRKDVFKRKNVTVVPQSWDDLLVVLNLLNGKTATMSNKEADYYRPDGWNPSGRSPSPT